VAHGITNADEATQRFWELSNRLRSNAIEGAVARDYLLALAIFTLLKHADIEDGERQAIAEFDGNEYGRQMPSELSWAVISSIDSAILRSSLVSKVWPILKTLSPSEITSPLRRFAAALDVNVIDESVLTTARGVVADLWTHAGGRDVLAKVFEQALRTWIEQTRFSGEFTTPAALADLMVELAAPRVGDRVYDPCFGTGGLLVRAARRIVHEGMSLSAEDWARLSSWSIFGVDINPHLALIATARLVLAGMSFPKLEIGNSLERNGIGDHGNEGFDCILANPPFGTRVGNEAAASRFRVRSNSGDLLFLQHILRSLRPGGRAVVAVPEALLFRAGAEAKLREILLKEYRVDAVLSLPAGSLAPYTSVKTSLLLFSRQAPLRTVCFVRPEIVKKILTDDESSVRHDLIRTIQNRRAGEPDQKKHTWYIYPGGPAPDLAAGHVELKQVDRIAQRNWELVVKDTSENALEALIGRIVEARPNTEIRTLGDIAEVFAGVPYDKTSLQDYSPSTGLEDAVPFVRVQEVTRPLARPSSDGSKGLPEVRIPTVKLTGPRFAKIKEKQKLRTGDLLVTASGTVGRVAIVGEAVSGAVPAHSLIVVRPTGDMQPAMLLRLLQAATYQRWLESEVTGASIKHLSPRVLRNMPVVMFDRATQRVLARDLSEDAGDEAILELLSRSTGQSYWVTFLLNNTTLAELERAKRPSEMVPLVDRWINEFRELGSKFEKGKEREPIANWLLWWTSSLTRVRETKEIPDTMSRFATLQSWRNEFVHGNVSWLPPGSGKTHFLARLTRDMEGSESGMLDTDAIGDTFATWLASSSRSSSTDDRLALVIRDHVARLSPLPLVLAQSEMAGLLEPVKFTATPTPSVVAAANEQEIKVSVRNEGPLALRKVGLRIAEQGLPHNDPAERSLLGGLLLDGSAVANVAASVRPEDFANQNHATIYRELVTMASCGRRIDLFTVIERLSFAGELESVGGFAYLSSLTDGLQLPVGVRELARVVHDTARFRSNFIPVQAADDTTVLAPGNEISVPVRIPAGPPRQITLQLSWSAQRLDNSPVSGSIDLGVEVRANDEFAPLVELGRSPYVVGPPIDRPSMFYGRADVSAQIQRALRTDGPASVILLEGNRRTGKTSILKHLMKSADLQGWVCVYCSFQSTEGQRGTAGIATGEVFYSIARELILAVHNAGFSWDVPGIGTLNQNLSKAALRHLILTRVHPLFEGSTPFEQFQIIVEAAIGTVAPNRVLLMLDEFDKLQEGIDHGITSPQVPENIRYLFHTYSEISGILTGSRRIKRLRDEYWSALFGIGNVISVSALDEHAARSLVTKPVEGRLVFAPAAVDRILFLTARHPFLIQSLCHRIFEKCAASGDRNVTTTTVDSAADQLVADNEHFRTLWDYIRTDRRRFIVCLIDRLWGGPNKVTLGLIAEKIAEEQIPYRNELALVKDIEELRELEVIDLKHDELEPVYSIAVPLFSMWLHGAIDSNVCRLGALQEEEQ